MAETIVSINHIEKCFRDTLPPFKALKDVNLTVQQGEFVCFIGPSGCGKSTLLRILAGFESADKGNIVYKTKPDTAMVFQNFALFPWLTIKENIAFGLRMQKKDTAFIHKQVSDFAKILGLTDFLDKHPKELSGGLKQRVGIARALVVQPNILFMDEPFSSLDAFTAKTLRQEILQIWEKHRPTIIMVTHLVEEAVELADRIVVFSPRPGTVEEILPVRLPRPRQKRSEAFYKLVDRLERYIVSS